MTTDRVVRTPALGRGAGQPDLGDHNLRVVADTIRRADPAGISRVELTQATGLASQTITNVVRRLLTNQIVVEGGVRSTGPGKPRTLVRLNADGAYAFGVHVDPLVVDVILMDLRGTILARADHAAPDDEEPSTTLDLLAATMDGLVERTGIDRGRLAGVGVAAPGPIDLATGTLIDPPLLPHWHGTPLSQELQRRTGLAVAVRKDVAAAAIGEMWARTHVDTASFLFCYLGTGTGMAATVNGTLHEGSSGNAGEIGHWPHAGVGPRCAACGQHHLGYATAPASWCAEAVALGLMTAPALEHPLPREVAEGVRQLAGLASAGDPQARGIFERAGHALGSALADMSDLFDVPEVVLGGPYWELVGPMMGDAVTAQVTRLPVLSSLRPVATRTAQHGRDCSAIGAASLVWHRMLGGLPALTAVRPGG